MITSPGFAGSGSDPLFQPNIHPRGFAVHDLLGQGELVPEGNGQVFPVRHRDDPALPAPLVKGQVERLLGDRGILRIFTKDRLRYEFFEIGGSPPFFLQTLTGSPLHGLIAGLAFTTGMPSRGTTGTAATGFTTEVRAVRFTEVTAAGSSALITGWRCPQAGCTPGNRDWRRKNYRSRFIRNDDRFPGSDVFLLPLIIINPHCGGKRTVAEFADIHVLLCRLFKKIRPHG